ncbi:MAG: FixH family protein [Salibacteraceae bacterium]
MKFNWGHGITIVFILFVGYILSFVYRSFFNQVDLVAEDYYAQEVAYQDRIDQTANAKYLDDKVHVVKTSEGVSFGFPASETMDDESGMLHFFRPSDEDMDLRIPIKLDEKSTQLIPLQLFHKGRYEVNISWRKDNKAFFIKKSIVI